ncbi:unnamed protein product [Blepharisma stoltei]|uniref:Uncharacterized protein n=1 Tax=Blepharisma stoltei TaxID=1481888 RepID=A0AAU9K6W5_9CILI|nr:unnamed protein product [Blepharisma stoltei]
MAIDGVKWVDISYAYLLKENLPLRKVGENYSTKARKARLLLKPLIKGVTFGSTELYTMYSLLRFRRARQFCTYFFLMQIGGVMKLLRLAE